MSKSGSRPIFKRLLDEGQFVASYKFALLLSLADLFIEKGDDSGSALTLTADEIGEKFVHYYWRQAIPYRADAKARVLQQNIGKQAAAVNIIRAARELHGDSLAAVMKQPEIWNNLRRNTAAVVRIMPLWKPQTVGRERLDFLYENADEGKTIDLRPGVAYCFRRFHALISDLVRGAWVRYVRQQNLNILGEAADLNEFLFDSERAALAVVRPVLIDIQSAGAFIATSAYLRPARTSIVSSPGRVTGWTWAITSCSPTADAIARSGTGCQPTNYLPAWTERNRHYGDQIGAAMEERGIVSELAASNRVAQWAYAQAESAGGLTWLRSDELVPLAAGRRGLF
jgi:hypothetical protein